jgi:hypothetical protein
MMVQVAARLEPLSHPTRAQRMVRQSVASTQTIKK